MKAERNFVPVKNSWMRAMCVIDPAGRRIAANDNVSRAMRVLRWDRRLRAARRFGLVLLGVFFAAGVVLANDQGLPLWGVAFGVAALVAFWGAIKK